MNGWPPGRAAFLYFRRRDSEYENTGCGKLKVNFRTYFNIAAFGVQYLYVLYSTSNMTRNLVPYPRSNSRRQDIPQGRVYSPARREYGEVYDFIYSEIC